MKADHKLKHLRDLDIAQIEKPKSLIILHYRNRRISVPLFQETHHIAQLLYKHIAKLEETVLNSGPGWERRDNAQIVCFQIKKENHQEVSDGDLKSDILLSLLRVENSETHQNMSFRVDITKIYKYLEIQPYYQNFSSMITEIQPRPSFFYFYRLINQSTISSTYLARRVKDGNFFSVRVYIGGSRCAAEDLKSIQTIQKIDDRQGQNDKSSLLVRSQQLFFIPQSGAEEGQEDNIFNCRYLAIVYPYFIKGSLQEWLRQSRLVRTKKIDEMDCLNYMKDLMWGAHVLHQKYNLIHRAIVPSNIEIDQNGQLKLINYSSCVPCYSGKQYAKYQNRVSRFRGPCMLEQLFQQGEYDLGEYTPPQVAKGAAYNYLVDYYTIGIMIGKMYSLSQAHQGTPVSQNKQNLMLTMINRLTSSDLQVRASIVDQIIQDIQKQNSEAYNSNQTNRAFSLIDIQIGKTIQLTSSQKFIENNENFNNIQLAAVKQFFRQPQRNKKSQRGKKISRKVSKDKSIGKNSREKSQKSLSKGSAQTQHKETKTKQFKQKSKFSQIPIRKIVPDSPTIKKHSKSKQGQKRKQTSNHKNNTKKDETKNIHAVMLPKSPKSTVVRAKSPPCKNK